MPGSKWINYTRPSEDSEVPRTRRSYMRPNVARYLLDGPLLPSISETLPLAEAARRRLMGIYGRLTQYNGLSGRSATLSGKDENLLLHDRSAERTAELVALEAILAGGIKILRIQ